MIPEDTRIGIIKPLFKLGFPQEPIIYIFISFFKGRYPMHEVFYLFLCCFPNELWQPFLTARGLEQIILNSLCCISCLLILAARFPSWMVLYCRAWTEWSKTTRWYLKLELTFPNRVSKGSHCTRRNTTTEMYSTQRDINTQSWQTQQ